MIARLRHMHESNLSEVLALIACTQNEAQMSAQVGIYLSNVVREGGLMANLYGNALPNSSMIL